MSSGLAVNGVAHDTPHGQHSLRKLGSKRNTRITKRKTRIKTFRNQFKLAELSFSASFFLLTVLYMAVIV